VSGGVTFHTVRHTVATLAAELGIPERLRMELMGHKEIRTTQQYTHLAAASQIAPHEQLSAALPLQEIVLSPQKGGSGKRFGTRTRKVQKHAETRRVRAAH
jgi:Phage integrase family